MNLSSLNKAVRNEVPELTVEGADKVIKAVFNSIMNALATENRVSLLGFGVFKKINQKARKGRNPQTGEEINIPASNRVIFSSGKKFKEIINNETKVTPHPAKEDKNVAEAKVKKPVVPKVVTPPVPKKEA